MSQSCLAFLVCSSSRDKIATIIRVKKDLLAHDSRICDSTRGHKFQVPSEFGAVSGNPS